MLRRYYSDSFISKEDIEADVEEELEAEWWDGFNLEFERSDADEETTETNPDAQPGLTEPLSSPSGVTKAASHGQDYQTISPEQFRAQKVKFAQLILQDALP